MKSVLSIFRVLWIAPFLVETGATAETGVDFQRDVRPILSNHCFACHGPDENARKAGLRLDRPASARRAADSGLAVIEPGQPDRSEIVRRVFASDENEIMPPPGHKRPLNEEQKSTLRQWVAEGAEYESHWSFIPPVKPPLPEIPQSEWLRNEIDSFVLARLEAEGMKPSPEADPWTLVRRVYLDLIGLPPTPEQADAFIQDVSDKAYERLVDELLASPKYGERWARRWLDLARYADSNGYEKDRPRSIWPYRDWVIEALNRDMPFDRFTIEQLAGDMLPDATQEQIVATGFHRNTMLNEEGGIDPLEYRFHSMVDRVHVTATTWLGMTMACAQCHTHKYDPITQKEYYQFMAFLDNADEPTIDVVDPEIQKRRASIQVRIQKLESQLASRFPPKRTFDWTTLHDGKLQSEAADAANLDDEGFWNLARNDAGAEGKANVSVEWMTDAPDKDWVRLEIRGDSFYLRELTLTAAPENKPDQRLALEWNLAESDSSAKGNAVARAIDGRAETGWSPWQGGAASDTHIGLFQLQGAPSWSGKTRWSLTMESGRDKQKERVGRFRVRQGNEVQTDLAMEERRSKHFDSRFAKWLDRESSKAAPWIPMTPVEASSDPPYLQIESDGSVFASGDFTKQDTYRLRFDSPSVAARSIRLEAIADDRLPEHGPGTVSYEGPRGDFWLSDIKILQSNNDRKIAKASESFSSGGNNAGKTIDDDLQSGWSVNGGQGRDHEAVWNLEHSLNSNEPFEIRLLFERYYAAGLGRFRIWIAENENALASPHPVEIQRLLSSPAETRTGEQIRSLKEYYATIAPELESSREEIDRLRNSLPAYPTTLAMRERPEENPRPTFVRKRGEFLNPLDRVEPDVPEVLSDYPEDMERDRLGFARWLVSRDNPLTARVVMNRHWEAFFGRGLAGTLEDFGFQGDLPTHPKLLDWLATTFMERGWSVKRMHKTIVMSAAYRQSSRISAKNLQRDPQNRYLSRGPRFRLEAEIIRDSLLAASGLLSRKIGGPSVFPPQPAGVTTEGAYRAFQWNVSEGADRYRRSLYTFAKRTTPFAMLTAFDAPTGEACVPRRETSNTPLQSLTLLNDEMFMEMARALGSSIAGLEGSDESKMKRLFRRCLVRPPTEAETDKLIAFYTQTLERFESEDLQAGAFLQGESTARANEQAAWTAVARVMFNLDEMVTKN